MKATMDGQSYTFKADGKDNMTPWGMTLAWKGAGANTWETTEKTKGKVSCTSIVKLSADGKMLTVDSKRLKADGGVTNDSISFERVSGGPGLAGKWKTKNLKSSSPETLSSDRERKRRPDDLLGEYGRRLRRQVRRQGVTGALWPAGWTCVVAKSGAQGITLTWKKDGKEMYKATHYDIQIIHNNRNGAGVGAVDTAQSDD